MKVQRVRVNEKTMGSVKLFRAEREQSILWGLIKYWDGFQAYKGSGTIYQSSRWTENKGFACETILHYELLIDHDIEIVNI